MEEADWMEEVDWVQIGWLEEADSEDTCLESVELVGRAGRRLWAGGWREEATCFLWLVGWGAEEFGFLELVGWWEDVGFLELVGWWEEVGFLEPVGWWGDVGFLWAGGRTWASFFESFDQNRKFSNI